MGLLGSIVGGVFGLFGSKKQKTTSSVDYSAMVRNATKAGFNPLTAIRNGGSAGFTTTTSPSTSSLPGALQSIGGALGDAMSDRFDPVAKKQRQLDTALVDYQLRQLREGPRAAVGSLYSGAQYTGTKVSNVTPSMTGNKKGFIGPPMPEHLKLGIGKEMPMYVWAVDDNGKRHRFPNPDLPDLDQMLVPSTGIVADEASTAVKRSPGGFGEWLYYVRDRMERMTSRSVIKPVRRSGGGGGW